MCIAHLGRFSYMFFSGFRVLSELASAPVMALAFARNGDQLLICEESSVTEWDVRSLTPNHRFLRGEGFQRLALSVDEEMMAVGDDYGRVQVINRAHRSYLPWIQWHVLPVADLLFKSDGTLVVSSFGTSEWDPRRGKKLLSSFHFDVDNATVDGGAYRSLLLTVHAAKEVSNGKIATCSSDGYLRIVNGEHVERSIQIDEASLASLDVTLAGYVVAGTERGEVIAVNLESEEIVWRTKVSDGWIAEVIAAPDKKHLIALGESLEVLTLDGRRIQSYPMGEDPALCGVFSPCGTYLYVGMHYNGVSRCEVA